MIENIKNIIFDLGGVILDIDYTKNIEAFKKLGLKEIEDIFNHWKQDSLFEEFEKGSFTPDEFRTKIRELIKKPLTDKEIDAAWNAMLLNYKIERIELLKLLKLQYRTFLLSNTNLLHCEYYNNLLKNQHNVNGLGELFEKTYYSHELGMRKPGKEIYQYVLKDAGLIASETLFLDDLEANLKSPQEIGMKVIHISPKYTINHIVW